jgi:hypothetical protein
MKNLDITEQDKEDIKLSHQYRLKVIPPRQSSFRVVALIYYQLLGEEDDSTDTSTINYVVGTNDEPCYMNGSICAERAALVQLRFLPIQRITKVVITTDSPQPIFPGFLCREFMCSHVNLDPEFVSIITAGSLCCGDGCCGLDISIGGGGSGSISTTAMKSKNANEEAGLDENMNSFGNCLGGDGDQGFHKWNTVKTSLIKLYPHPSPYTRLDARQCAKLGPRLSNKISQIQKQASFALSPEAQNLIVKATEAANRGNDRSQLHPIQYAAAVLFEDGTIQTACQRKCLEYGCSLDAVTQLGTYMEKERDQAQTQTLEKRNDNSVVHVGFSIPILLVQTDQFGVLHAPFATARAYLSEFGFGDMKVLISQPCRDKNGITSTKGSAEEGSEEENNVQILEVTVRDLAPSAPDMGSLFKE